jgi:hypothetical protein
MSASPAAPYAPASPYSPAATNMPGNQGTANPMSLGEVLALKASKVSRRRHPPRSTESMYSAPLPEATV